MGHPPQQRGGNLGLDPDIGEQFEECLHEKYEQDTVRIRTSHHFRVFTLILFFAGSLPLQGQARKSTDIKVLGERVERVSREEAHFWLKVVNESDGPVSLIGIKYRGPRPHSRPYYLFLQQWRGEEGWKSVAPCMDYPPRDVITLNRSAAIPLDFALKLPLSAVCKERNVQWEGKFRYRLEYFKSSKDARTYIKLMESPGHQPARVAVAVSEPFEIPPIRN